MEKDRFIIDQTIDVDPSAADLNEGEVAGREISRETTDSEVTFGS